MFLEARKVKFKVHSFSKEFFVVKIEEEKGGWGIVDLGGFIKIGDITVTLSTESIKEAFLQKNKDNPFFLYVTHNTIHTPIMGKKELVEKYKDKPGADLPQNNPIVAAMIEELDNSVGDLLANRLNE